MIKSIARNRRARHDYHLEEYFEAGIVLEGNEVKSIKNGNVSIKEAFCLVRDGEVFIHNMHINPYTYSNNFSKQDPIRTRKLLLNKNEIRKIDTKITEKGYALLPIEIKDKNGLIKLDIAIGKGKKLYDKRQDLKEKDDRRRIERAMSERY